MRITFLGSGGAFCDFRVNYHNNALVWTSEGPVLIDCGLTAVQSMRELGIERTSIAAALFTHLHSDHASPELLMWERYFSGPDGQPSYLPTRLGAPSDVMEPLLRSLHPFMDEYADRSGRIRTGGMNAVARPEACTTLDVGDTRFSWFRVPHVVGPEVDKPAYGLVVEQGGRKVLWSGDTTFSPRWVRDAAGDPDVAAIFHECLFADRFDNTVHTHWRELQTLPDEAKRRITLMHYTEVPDGVDISEVAGAAKRHEEFVL